MGDVNPLKMNASLRPRQYAQVGLYVHAFFEVRNDNGTWGNGERTDLPAGKPFSGHGMCIFGALGRGTLGF